MKAFRSRLYEGRVFHQRYRPRKHRLSYRVFSILVDLDELEELDRAHWMFGYNRFSLLSFWDKDYGPGQNRPLIDYVHATLKAAGIDLDRGRVTMLCYPRLFGYAFNPLSVYYCYDAQEQLKVMLYEVSNTFGERHTYLIEVEDDGSKTVRQSCCKEFYVSPFMDMSGEYRFRLSQPSDNITVLIDQCDADGVMLKASFTGQALDVSDRALATLVLKYPFMTLKVMAGIHWEALKLWRKGLKLFDRPAPPLSPITHVQSKSMESET
ncbi:DUF1365 domain-containing protein [Magnetovibrio sp. PR-2]|uniref:DUF1365 domain-containing protein n=1 Tax=Magnetovibrio sp. PR-2 TaxID=3120356 RepID=UPI002FCDF692